MSNIDIIKQALNKHYGLDADEALGDEDFGQSTGIAQRLQQAAASLHPDQSSSRISVASSVAVERLADMGLAKLAALVGAPGKAAQVTIETHLIPRVRRALTRLSDEALREDVIQELRVRMFAETPSLLEGYQGQGPLASYLIVIAMRAAFHRRKQANRYQMQVMRVASTSEYRRSYEDAPDAQMVRQQQRQACRAAVKKSFLQ